VFWEGYAICRVSTGAGERCRKEGAWEVKSGMAVKIYNVCFFKPQKKILKGLIRNDKIVDVSFGPDQYPKYTRSIRKDE